MNPAKLAVARAEQLNYTVRFVGGEVGWVLLRPDGAYHGTYATATALLEAALPLQEPEDLRDEAKLVSPATGAVLASFAAGAPLRRPSPLQRARSAVVTLVRALLRRSAE
ncbi:MAG: hypothetical protein U0167_15440 [bacterium]